MFERISFVTVQAFCKRLTPSRWLISFAAVVLLPGYSEMLGSVSRWRWLSWRDLFPDHYQVIVSLFCCSLREEGAFLLCAGGPSESSQAVSSTASNRFLTVNKIHLTVYTKRSICPLYCSWSTVNNALPPSLLLLTPRSLPSMHASAHHPQVLGSI